MTILITGAAGFIGSHVAQALLARGDQVVGIDNLNDYYSVALKRARLERLDGKPGFSFIQADVADKASIDGVLAQAKAKGQKVTGIIHLAAQAGVRYSLENPYAYADANVMGQVVMLEAARSLDRLDHFVYASSSSVYGSNTKLPFSIGLGLLKVDILPVLAALAPIVLLGAFVGRRWVRRLDQQRFNQIVIALTIVSSLYLLR